MANSSHETQMPLDLLMEVLVRLPGKSLMRFKSVSKYWFALITHPVFIDKHHTRSNVREGGVFHVQFPAETDYRRRPRCWDRRFLLIDWTRKDPMTRATVHDPSSVPYYTANTVSNIVNGLICFYHHHFSNKCISVYNFTTRENLPLPSPPLPPLSSNPTFLNRIYYLGFDPINKLYKVLHFWSTGYKTQDEAFITVVLNDNRWRPIKACPYVTRIQHCTSVCCIDGFLYWQNGMDRVVVEFDVNREKFSHINYPLQEVTHEPVDDDYWARRPRKLTQIRGQLSLVAMPPYYKCDDIVIKIWRLVDRTDNHRSVWSKEVVACPFFLNYANCPFGLNSFGLITLVHHLPVPGQVLIDCYVLATRKYKQLKINNAEAFLRPGYEFCPSKLVENIMPLKNIERRLMLDL